MKSLSLVLALLSLSGPGAFAARIDLTSHSTGLARALSISIPIESRYYDGEEQELHVRGDHDVIIPYPVARAELEGLRDFLGGQPLEGKFHLNLRGKVVVRTAADQVLDLDLDSVLNGEAYQTRKGEEMEQRLLDLGFFKIAAGQFVYEGFVQRGPQPGPAGAAVSLHEAAQNSLRTMAKQMALARLPARLRDALTDEPVDPPETIVAHVISGNSNMDPLDLAFESAGRIAELSQALLEEERLIVEIDDSRLEPAARVRFRKALNFLRLSQYWPDGRSFAHARLRYLFNAEHTCVGDLERRPRGS